MSSGSSQLDPREASDEHSSTALPTETLTTGRPLEMSISSTERQIGTPEMVDREEARPSLAAETWPPQTALRGNSWRRRATRGRERVERSRPYHNRRRWGAGRNRTMEIVSETAASQLLLQLNVMGTVNLHSSREIGISIQLQAPEGVTASFVTRPSLINNNNEEANNASNNNNDEANNNNNNGNNTGNQNEQDRSNSAD